jgi:flagellar assembly factor FliW
MVDDPNLSFLVVPPGDAIEEYEPDLSDEDTAYLELTDSQEALVLNVVTLHSEGNATVNLKGPIVINRRTLRGKQVIPRNVSNFALQHPLNLNGTESR